MYHSPLLFFKNPWVCAGLAGWFVAQFVKLVHSFIRTRTFDFAYFVSTGGMPSAHSAAVSAVAWSVGLTEGFDSATFAVAFTIAAVTMFDASTLRLNAGRQARLLNQITRELFAGHGIPQEPLRELLGHTRLEVFAGMLVGIAVSTLVIRALA